MNQLVRYEAARVALHAANSVDEVKDIRDKAQAMAAYARQANDTELVEWATEIKVRAERRAGEMLAAMNLQPGPKKDNTTLVSIGVSANQSSRWQKLAAVPEDQFEQAVAAAKEVAGEVTTAAMLRLSHNHRAQGTGENEWYTPPEWIELARNVMGAFDLDPASSEMAQRRIRAGKYFAIDDDGLNQEWSGRVWLNPPYSQPAISLFVEKLVCSYRKGSVTEAILLTHNYTDTAWFQLAAADADSICFPRGRVAFLSPTGEKAAPTQGQAFFYYGIRPKIFLEVFGPVGFAVTPL